MVPYSKCAAIKPPSALRRLMCGGNAFRAHWSASVPRRGADGAATRTAASFAFLVLFVRIVNKNACEEARGHFLARRSVHTHRTKPSTFARLLGGAVRAGKTPIRLGCFRALPPEPRPSVRKSGGSAVTLAPRQTATRRAYARRPRSAPDVGGPRSKSEPYPASIVCAASTRERGENRACRPACSPGTATTAGGQTGPIIDAPSVGRVDRQRTRSWMTRACAITRREPRREGEVAGEGRIA